MLDNGAGWVLPRAAQILLSLSRSCQRDGCQLSCSFTARAHTAHTFVLEVLVEGQDRLHVIHGILQQLLVQGPLQPC